MLPIIAPIVVKISKVNPSFKLVRPFLKKSLKADIEVAMTATRLVPTAFCIGIFKTSVNKGTIIIPPPIPTMEPRNPAPIPIKIK